MDATQALRQALEAVEHAAIPADLRPLAFTTAVELVVSGRVSAHGAGPAAPVPPAVSARTAWPARAVEPEAAPATPQEPAPASAPQPPEPAAADEVPSPRAAGPRAVPPLAAVPPPRPEEVWDRIAAQLGVRAELLDRLYDEHAGRLRLTGDVSRLGRNRAERVGNAALLLLAALRWSGLDEGHPVPDAVLRTEVERLGLLDTGNYTKHLAARRGLLQITGSGRAATYKLRYDGAEEARRLARTLLEEG